MTIKSNWKITVLDKLSNDPSFRDSFKKDPRKAVESLNLHVSVDELAAIDELAKNPTLLTNGMAMVESMAAGKRYDNDCSKPKP